MADRGGEGTAIERWRVALEAAGVGVWDWDVRSGEVWWSDNLPGILGIPPEAFDGSVAGFVGLVHPNDRERVRAALAGALDRGQDYEVEFRVAGADGRERRILGKGRVVRDGAGRPVRMVGTGTDATARHEAAASRQRLAAIVESSEDAIIGKTLDLVITDWNPGAERLYGYAAAEIVGDTIARIVPPERADELPAIVERLRRGERVAPFETVRVAKDGRRLAVSVAASPIVDPAGVVVGAATIARDVTARQRAEQGHRFLAEAGEVLASSLDYEATLANAARLAVPRLADWCVVDVVDADDEAAGVRRVAVAHADPAKAAAAGVLLRYPPDPAKPVGAGRVLATGRSDLVPDVPAGFVEAVALDPAHLDALRTVGQRSWMGVALRARGRILGVLSLVAAESGRRFGPDDLTLAEELANRAALAVDNARLFGEARAAETRYRGLFEGVADAILVADAARRYREVNAAAAELLGYERDELLGLGVDDLVVGEPGWLGTEHARFVAEGRWQGELDLRRKDGTTVPVEARATAIDLPTGPVYLSAVRDVTERRRLERMQQDFIAMVSHDLRTPITVLTASAQLMKRRGTYDERRLDLILAQAERMDRLVADLRDVAALEAGQIGLRPAPVDLVELARWAAERANSHAAAHRVRVEAPDAPLVGRWDRDRLGQVLDNLLGNAVKYSPAGAEVLVRVEPTGCEARVSVVDRGVGVAPEAIPRLFDRFYRADGTGAASGLGLGLYIARMLVEAHGGRIWAESAPGAGSTFTVALPLDPTARPAARPPSPG